MGLLASFAPVDGIGIALKLADGAARAKDGVLDRPGLAKAADTPAPAIDDAIPDSNGTPVGNIAGVLPAWRHKRREQNAFVLADGPGYHRCTVVVAAH